jgi:hypothetical protein
MSSAPSSPLPGASTSMSLSLWQLATRLFLPQSLANQAQVNSTINSINESKNSQFQEQLCALKSAVKPGDLIIVRTPGYFYTVFRGLAGHSFDHLAIVLNNHEFLHVGPPLIRLLPIELLLQPNRNPIVLRPKLTPEELQDLLGKLQPLVGKSYDNVKVYSFVAKLAVQKFITGKNERLKQKLAQYNSQNSSDSLDVHSFICTDAILNRLLSVSGEFRRSARSISAELDYSFLKSWSINDVYNLALLRPQLLELVHLPKINSKLWDIVQANSRLKNRIIGSNYGQNYYLQSTISNNNDNKSLAAKLNSLLSTILTKKLHFPLESVKFSQFLAVYRYLNTLLPLSAYFHNTFLLTFLYLLVKHYFKRKVGVSKLTLLRKTLGHGRKLKHKLKSKL